MSGGGGPPMVACWKRHWAFGSLKHNNTPQIISAKIVVSVIWRMLFHLIAKPLHLVSLYAKLLINYLAQNTCKPRGKIVLLTHWGRVRHICAGKLTMIGSNNGLSPCRRQAIIWTNAGILLIEPLGTYFSEILILIHRIQEFKNSRIQENAFENVVWKMAAMLSRPQCVNGVVDATANPLYLAPLGIKQVLKFTWEYWREGTVCWMSIMIARAETLNGRMSHSCFRSTIFWNIWIFTDTRSPKCRKI